MCWKLTECLNSCLKGLLECWLYMHYRTGRHWNHTHTHTHTHTLILHITHTHHTCTSALTHTSHTHIIHTSITHSSYTSHTTHAHLHTHTSHTHIIHTSYTHHTHTTHAHHTHTHHTHITHTHTILSSCNKISTKISPGVWTFIWVAQLFAKVDNPGDMWTLSKSNFLDMESVWASCYTLRML